MCARWMGVIVICVLVVGALSGVEACYSVAVFSVDLIVIVFDYCIDVMWVQRLGVFVREGHVENLIEASIRLAVSSDAVSTVLVGYSSLEHLEAAATAVNRGPLPLAALQRLGALWSELA